ncbi:U1 small nuclear ribonucleoprotein 70 kDa [Bienertia sinuspersici]
MVFDKESNKPKGYAFIEFAHTRDMKAAYKQADGKKIDGRRVLVDVERGRTVPNWRPRRLGGGLGTTRVGGEDVNQRSSTREDQESENGWTRASLPKLRGQICNVYLIKGASIRRTISIRGAQDTRGEKCHEHMEVSLVNLRFCACTLFGLEELERKGGKGNVRD